MLFWTGAQLSTRTAYVNALATDTGKLTAAQPTLVSNGLSHGTSGLVVGPMPCQHALDQHMQKTNMRGSQRYTEEPQLNFLQALRRSTTKGTSTIQTNGTLPATTCRSHSDLMRQPTATTAATACPMAISKLASPTSQDMNQAFVLGVCHQDVRQNQPSRCAAFPQVARCEQN